MSAHAGAEAGGPGVPGAPPALPRLSLAGVFDPLTDLIVVIDVDGTIRYVNPFGGELLGIDPSRALGTNIAEFVHPDDLLRALEVMGMMVDESMVAPVTPAEYRLRRRDGTWFPVEVNGAVLPTTPEQMLLVCRYSGDRDVQGAILALLTAGAPTEEIVDLVPRFGTWRHPFEHYAVLYTADDGTPTTAGTPLAEKLTALDPPMSPYTLPWVEAVATGQEQVVDVERLPPDLRDAAVSHGVSACWARVVPDPRGGAPAVLMAWVRTEGAARLAHRYALEAMASALTLVLQFRKNRVELEAAAQTDPLTGVANRNRFFALLDDALSPDSGGSAVGVCYVDLDGFKTVNDALGHAAGDQVLQVLAGRIAAVVRPEDTVARLGGDEFAVLCPRLTAASDAAAIADRIVDSADAPIDLGSTVVTVTASVGVATATAGSVAADALVSRADGALYEAKSQGRNQWRMAPG